MNKEDREMKNHTQDSQGVHTGESHGEVHHEISIAAEPIFSIGSFPVVNSLLTSWIVAIILIILSFILKFRIKKIPGKFQLIWETLYEEALNLADQVTGDRKISAQALPIALTAFIFILASNWLGILPGVGSIGMIVAEHGKEVFIPYLRGGTADINTTLALSLISVIGANIFGIISIGIWKTFNKFINLKVLSEMVTKVKKDPTVLIVAPITFFVGLIEIIGEIAKIASLSFRLFGNVFAGEVLLASIASLVSFIVPIPFLFLEILVGFIQALIFAVLTLVYFTIASMDHDHEHEEEHAHVNKHTEKEVIVV